MCQLYKIGYCVDMHYFNELVCYRSQTILSMSWGYVIANYRHSSKKIEKTETISWHRSLYGLECKIL